MSESEAAFRIIEQPVDRLRSLAGGLAAIILGEQATRSKIVFVENFLLEFAAEIKRTTLES